MIAMIQVIQMTAMQISTSSAGSFHIVGVVGVDFQAFRPHIHDGLAWKFMLGHPPETKTFSSFLRHGENTLFLFYNGNLTGDGSNDSYVKSKLATFRNPFNIDFLIDLHACILLTSLHLSV